MKVHVYRRHEVVEQDNSDLNAIELDTELSTNSLSTNPETFEHGCKCEKDVCTCCRHLTVRKVRLNDIGRPFKSLASTKCCNTAHSYAKFQCLQILNSADNNIVYRFTNQIG